MIGHDGSYSAQTAIRPASSTGTGSWARLFEIGRRHILNIDIAHGISANAVRLQAQALYRRQGGTDHCLKCEPVVRAPLEAERPLRPDAPALPGPMSDGARQWPSGLLFSCPTSGRQVPTGIETNVQSLRALWRRKLKLDCPHCGEVHEFSVREAYLNSALKDANDRTI